MKSFVWSLMKKLEMPESLMTEKSSHALIFLLFSRVYNERDITANSELSELTKFLSELNLPFNQIFQQNTVQKRQIFFSNELVKWLWHKVFFKMQPTHILNYLRRVRSYPQEGEERYRTLVKDMRQVEQNCQAQLLPKNCLSCKNVTLFTREEMEKDAATQWKYNKRNQTLLTEWLRQNQGKTPSNRPTNTGDKLTDESDFQKMLLGEDEELDNSIDNQPQICQL